MRNEFGHGFEALPFILTITHFSELRINKFEFLDRILLLLSLITFYVYETKRGCSNN